MKAALTRVLGSRWLHHVLWAANLLAMAGVAYVNWGGRGVDQPSYLALANSILHGHYSQWMQFDPPIPDTFRTPGYPLYLAGVLAVFGEPKWIALVQMAMYAISIHLAFRILDRFNAGMIGRNMLLLLLAPSVNMTAVIFVVSPEIPVLFCMTVLAFTDTGTRRHSLLTAIGIGAILGFIFQARPVYLLYPIAHMLVAWWFERRALAWRPQLVTLTVFGLTLLPYGLWNKKNHGVFTITPLESGGGVFSLGYWCGRIPGYPSDHFYGNRISDEMIRFVPEASLAQERADYDREWETMETRLAPLLTQRDSMMRELGGGRPNICYSHNTAYTIAREKEIKRLTLQNIGEHPGYYAAFKAYTAVRLWIVGIDRSRFEGSGPLGRVGKVFAFLFTLMATGIGAWLVVIAHRRRLLSLRRTWPLVLWVVYTTVIHIPFAIQTRYTISARFILYILPLFWLAFTVAALGAFGPIQASSTGYPINPPASPAAETAPRTDTSSPTTPARSPRR